MDCVITIGQWTASSRSIFAHQLRVEQLAQAVDHHPLDHVFQRGPLGRGLVDEANAHAWLVIRSLAAVGLVKDIHLLPKNAEKFRIKRESVAVEPVEAAA